MNGIGYILKEYKLVPFSEAQPSPDGAAGAANARMEVAAAFLRRRPPLEKHRTSASRASARNRCPPSIPLGLRTLEGRHAAARSW
jgi:hypothetical protein